MPSLANNSKEAKFLSHITNQLSADKEYFSKYEWEQYQVGVQKLKDFKELKGLMDNYHEFYWELKNLYLETSRELSTHNAWNRREVLRST
jgi:hypothetical protein